MLKDKEKLRVLCYTAAPPLSEDDLKTLAEVRSLREASLDAGQVARLGDLLTSKVDGHRFPWLKESRLPTTQERHAAIVATCSLLCTQLVQTERRVVSSKAQEKAVRDFLLANNFSQVPAKRIDLYSEAPPPMCFMTETKLAEAKADFVVGIPGNRIVAIECKVSNSATNSHKRLVHEFLHKADEWKTFGAEFLTSVAVVSGIFSPRAVLQVKNKQGCAVVWQHNLRGLLPMFRV